MNNIIGIVNYGIAGNIYSIKKAIEMAGGIAKVLNTSSEFKEIDKIVIPGVGSFRDAMKELQNSNMIEVLKEHIKIKPTLGICLGMQIFSTLGFEYGKTKGLCVLDAEVKPMVVNGKVPHVGFNSIEIVKSNDLLDGLENEEFYFMHSYEVVNYVDIASLTNYNDHKFVSAIKKDNLYGVQFHPEKSRDAGIKLFKNFIGL